MRGLEVGADSRTPIGISAPGVVIAQAEQCAGPPDGRKGLA
jgi:hypothetical protein